MFEMTDVINDDAYLLVTDVDQSRSVINNLIVAMSLTKMKMSQLMLWGWGWGNKDKQKGDKMRTPCCGTFCHNGMF